MTKREHNRRLALFARRDAVFAARMEMHRLGAKATADGQWDVALAYHRMYDRCTKDYKAILAKLEEMI